jgi:hypothetical protein
VASFNKFNQFAEDIAKGVHNLDTGALTLALTNTTPTASNAVLADITQISYTNLSTRVLAGVDAEQTGGQLSLVATDHVLTASGAVGPFRYVVLYNDTPTSPADPLIGFWDYGSSISLATGETFTVDFGSSILTIQ